MIYKVLETAVTIIIVVVLSIVNLVIFVATGGNSFTEKQGDDCIEMLSDVYLDIELPEDSLGDISCDVKDVFPTFLASIEFTYSASDEYLQFLKENFEVVELESTEGKISYTFMANELNHTLSSVDSSNKFVHEVSY